jgi:shikimate dehydrogenase
MTDRYLVVGSPIRHSLSPAIHQAAFDELSIDATYSARQVEAGNLKPVIDDLRAGRLAGVNVTMPHKNPACELVDRIDGDADLARSVNTLLRSGTEVVGMSTDIPAIRAEWQRKSLPDSSVLILGSGGAAAAALVALRDMEVFVSARHPSNLESLRQGLGIPFEIVPWATPVPGVALVNATPLGMNGESLPSGLLAGAEGLLRGTADAGGNRRKNARPAGCRWPRHARRAGRTVVRSLDRLLRPPKSDAKGCANRSRVVIPAPKFREMGSI